MVTSVFVQAFTGKQNTNRTHLREGFTARLTESAVISKTTNVFEIRAVPYGDRDVAARQGEHSGSGT